MVKPCITCILVLVVVSEVIGLRVCDFEGHRQVNRRICLCGRSSLRLNRKRGADLNGYRCSGYRPPYQHYRPCKCADCQEPPSDYPCGVSIYPYPDPDPDPVLENADQVKTYEEEATEAEPFEFGFERGNNHFVKQVYLCISRK